MGKGASQGNRLGKLKEDLDDYAKHVENGCGSKVAVEWTGGKLGHNPRESEKPEWNSISTLCTSAVEAIENACLNNSEVKAKLGKLTRVTCSKGKGSLGYSLKGTELNLTIDPSFVKNNAAGQRDDLVTKLKKDLDT